MAEWFKAAVLKTVERKLRGFESLSLRHNTSSMSRARCSEQHGEGYRFVRHERRTENAERQYNGEVAERLKAAAC
jgi:hypothetical protein